MPEIDLVDGKRPAGAGNSPAGAWRRALELTEPIPRSPSLTLPLVIDALADRFDATPALLSASECLSFRGLAERAAKYARWALGQGLAAGDVVALLMPNCPDYMAIWLGISRVGGVVALVNTNLTGDSLQHSIEVVAPKHVIVAASLAETFAAIAPRLPGIRAWAHGGDGNGWPRIDHAVEETALPACAIGRLPALSDRALYIYTSGTTGLPKAAAVSHFRLMQWSHWFAGMMDTQPSDRMYDCLPMYHSIGGIVATGATLVGGGSVFIRERFSASRFWDDIVEQGCTLFQYIGELCRYLGDAPPHPRETTHRLRLACGNGLRGDVWEPFQQRFRVPQILEFYAATEGNFSLYNCEGKPGAIGRTPSYLAHRFPVALVKFDVESGEPLRGADGFCIRCQRGEAGEAIGKIPEGRAGLAGRFEGYSDAAASERKVLRDVFAAGDAWYRTGDLMRQDQAGFYYFVDRAGDTFRWKGENVSTAEVAAAISACSGVADAVVYGVAIAGTEGRAGMAAILAADGFDLVALRRHLVERLPDYARPLFLRICESIAVTGTFKPRKQSLVADGFDPAATIDRLYFDDRATGAFVPLDAALYRRIERHELRL